MKKKYIYILVGILLICISGYRYYSINKNVAREYVVEKFEMNKEIQLDNSSIIVTEFKEIPVEKDEISASYEVQLDIKNTSDDVLNVSNIVECNLSSGIVSVSSSQVDEKVGKELKNLKPGDDVRLTLIYNVNDIDYKYFKTENDININIPNTLYWKEVIKNNKEYKRYFKSVVIA